MLKSGIDINNPVANSSSPWGEYPIQLTAQIMDEETSFQAVRILLKHGATPEPNKYGSVYELFKSPLRSAIALRHWAVTETLLGAGASGTSEVWQALIVGNTDMRLRLLDAGGDIESPCHIGHNSEPLALLGSAVKQGDLGLAEALVARGANVNALQGLENVVSYLCGHDGATTALGLAAHGGNLEMCKFLVLETHAETDAPIFSAPKVDDHTGCQCLPYFPLTIACRNGDIEILKFLIENGASVPLADKNGIVVRQDSPTPGCLLGMFILEPEPHEKIFDRKLDERDNSQSCLDVCKLLIQKGALLDGALAASATVQNLDLVQFFLAHGAPLHAPTWARSTKTALGYAIESGDVAIARSIYDAGGVETGELEAIPNEEMVEFMVCNGLFGPALLQYGPDIVNSAIKVPDENKTLLRRILRYDIDLCCDFGTLMGWKNPLVVAIGFSSDLKVIELLLQRGVSIHVDALKEVVNNISSLRREAAQGLGQRTAPRKTQSGEKEVAQINLLNLLLHYIPDAWKHGSADTSIDFLVSWNNGGDYLPFIVMAAAKGLRDIVHMLRKSVFCDSRHMGIILTEAIQCSNFLLAEDLLDMQPAPSLEESNLHYSDRHGVSESALIAAVRSGRVTLARKLIERGANVNYNGGGRSGTALQTASKLGHCEMVDLLLSHKADPNAAPATYKGATALQYAARGGHLRIVRKLLISDAEVNQTGCLYHGRTAVEGAAEYGRLEILDLLLR